MNTSLRALQLKARHQVYTLLSGHNLSKLYGEGYDFAELREYQVGDDIRKINWTITAKLGKPYIKELHANRELSVVVAALMDGTLYFDQDNEKQEKLAEAAMILGYAAQHNADLFTGLRYTQKGVKVTLPTKQLYLVENFSSELFDIPLLSTQLKIQPALQDIFKRVHKASLLFVIGDFLEEVDLSLLAQKHEVIAIVIRKREEESPSVLGEIHFRSPQSLMKIDTYFGKKSIARYQQKLRENDRRNAEHFSRFGIRSVKIFTDEESVSRLATLFR